MTFAEKSVKGAAGSIAEPGLKPMLNVFQGAALITGAMIGSGIFTNPGKALGIMGATLPTLILWVVGAFVAFFGALNYAELGSRVTLSGGDAPFLDYAFPKPRRFLAVMYSWTRVVLINPGYNSSLAYIAATYLGEAIPALAASEDGSVLAGVAIVSVASLSLFSLTGVAVLFGAAPSVRTTEAFSAEHFVKGTTSNPGEWASALFKILSLGELRNPERNIKRATLMGIGTVATLYGDKIASVWAERLFGPTGKILVTAIICLSVMSCCYVTLFSASRIGQATGEAGLIFPPNVSLNALMFNLVMSVILLWIPPSEDVFWFIINLVSYPLWLWYGLTAISLLVIKKRDAGNSYSGINVHPIGAIWVALVSTFLCIFPYFDADLVMPSALAWAFMALGVPAYFLLMRRERAAQNF
ncbi:hypothetical protein BCR44DRAFT_1441557 [Catenaria anguillulae PL171]|uniref:Amino acid/polyamine transporter I n=1 Tax=Catenaria anguillulae PL171 TaxID=765915 RepID=A0A1Y2HAX7_9FUNG|nr:hypothetical protein BCR44DRAFT_1441557 [Catenaria anguillulae PL171]